MNTLTLQEYRNTISNKMFEVKGTLKPTVDIWTYVEELVKEKIIDREMFENRVIDGIYRNSDNTYEHIQVPTIDTNIFTFIIADLNLGIVKGHYCLDL